MKPHFALSSKAILPVVLTKGIAMAAVLKFVADTGFIPGLLTAIASAVISGMFLIYSVHLTAKKAEDKVVRKVDEAKNEIVGKVKE